MPGIGVFVFQRSAAIFHNPSAPRRRIADAIAANQGKASLTRENAPPGVTTPNGASQVLFCDRRTASFQWAWEELNLRPHAYQACALTT